jgi:catechol 2,3-dioxygenase-like lactoylglutathione lyase family enzyme
MKRFHVHVSVDDLDQSIRFYASLFGVQPSVTQPDYAKWMLEDPRVNFAISKRNRAIGVNHLGFQVDSSEELKALKCQLEAADASLVEQTAVSCCYARSDKHWVNDPSGIAWETFHTLGSVPVYGDDSRTEKQGEACCIPLAAANDDQAACCVPKERNSNGACCG